MLDGALVDLRCSAVLFRATEDDRTKTPRGHEPGLAPAFVGLGDLADLPLRPPLAGYLRGLARTRPPAGASYLGNLWRAPQDGW